jgi:hypothetical protein
MALGPRVFAIQKQQRWDERKQELVDKFDLTSAKVYGELIFLLSPKAAPFNSVSVIEELHKKLSDFSDQDSLLLIGNPCLIGFAVAIASDQSPIGRVALLQWSGKDQKYIKVEAILYPEDN